MEVQTSRTGETVPTESLPYGETCFQKRTRRLLSNLPDGFTVVSMDGSIVIHDAIARRVWAPEGIRPICVVTGSHQRTVLFGALSLDGRQLFRQYAYFNKDTCLDFLKKIHRKFRRPYLFLDRARQHYRSAKVQGYIQRNEATLRVRWFPIGCQEFNVMEECWRQTDNDLLASRYYPSFLDLKTTVILLAVSPSIP